MVGTSQVTKSVVHEFERPPVAFLIGAGAALAVATALLYPRDFLWSILGYALAPLLVSTLVSLYRYRDILASHSVWYLASPQQRKAGTALVLLSFLVGLGHAWIIATELAKVFAS